MRVMALLHCHFPFPSPCGVMEFEHGRGYIRRDIDRFRPLAG